MAEIPATGRCMMLGVTAVKKKMRQRGGQTMPGPRFEKTGAIETQRTETGKQVVPLAWRAVIGRRHVYLQESFGSLHTANQRRVKPNADRGKHTVTRQSRDVTAWRPIGDRRSIGTTRLDRFSLQCDLLPFNHTQCLYPKGAYYISSADASIIQVHKELLACIQSVHKTLSTTICQAV